jgi:hypothetical protein
MATIKKAQNSGTVKDTTKTYETSPFQKAKQDKEKKKVEYKKFTSTKMKNGGSLSGLKASNKRVGPVDPKGAWTKVQKKTLAGAKGKASLTKDKQLGATKMAKGKKC